MISDSTRKLLPVFALMILFAATAAADGPSYFANAMKMYHEQNVKVNTLGSKAFGNFTRSFKQNLKADTHANEILTPHLTCKYTQAYDLIWTDKGSGAARDIGVWRPKCPPGWVRFGDLAVPTTSTSTPGDPALIAKWDDKHPGKDEKGPFLKKPVDYVWKWDDRKSGAKWDGSFWYPVPPKGYVSLGVVAQRNHSKPKDLGLVRCVRADLVLAGKYIGQIYTDRKSGAKYDCAAWSIGAADKVARLPYLVTNTFNIKNNYKNHPSEAPYVLKGLTGEDAYKDAYNGYVNTTANAIVSRTQQAVEKAREASQAQLNNNYARTADSAKDVEPGKRPAISQDHKKEETLESNQTARNRLPGIKIDKNSFKEAAKALGLPGGNMIDKIPGLLPFSFFKGIEIKDVKVIQGEIADGDEKGQPWLCVTGNVSLSLEKLGKISGQVTVLSRLFINDGVRTGLLITLPTEELLKKIPLLKSPPINQIKFSKTAITFATEEHEWHFSEMPVELKNELKEFAWNSDPTFSFVKGESAWLIAETKSHKTLSAPLGILSATPPKVLFKAIFPAEKDESFKISALLLSEIKTNFLPVGKFFNLGTPELQISLGEPKGLSLISDLNLKLSSSLHIGLPVSLTFTEGFNPAVDSISVTGMIPGMWKNMLGIKGLSMGNLKISGVFGKNPSLALGGNINLGDSWKFDVAGALSFESPIAISAIKCSLDRDLSLGDLIKLQGNLMHLAFPAVKFPSWPNASIPIADLKIKKPQFCVSEVDIPALDIYQGISFSGTLALGNLDLGSAQFSMLADSGIICKAWIKKFSLGPLAVTGAGPDKKDKTADDCPYIDIAYWPPSSPPFNLQQHCYISARADIAGFPFKMFMDLGFSSMKVDISADLGSAFSFFIRASGEQQILKDFTKGGSMSFTGEFKSELIEDIEKEAVKFAGGNTAVKAAVKLLGDSIIKIRSIKTSGSIADIAKGQLPHFDIHASAFGKSIVIKESLSIPPDKAAAHFGELIGKKIIEIAEDVIKDPIKFVGEVCEKVGDLGQDVAKDLTKVFGQSPAKTWSDAQSEAEQQAKEVQQVAEAGAKIAASTAKKAAETAAKTAKSVAKTMAKVASGAWHKIKSWF